MSVLGWIKSFRNKPQRVLSGEVVNGVPFDLLVPGIRYILGEYDCSYIEAGLFVPACRHRDRIIEFDMKKINNFPEKTFYADLNNYMVVLAKRINRRYSA